MSEAAATTSPGIHWQDFPDVLTPADLRRLLQVKSNKTISRLKQAGQLPNPAIKTGNIVRWRKADVMEMMERNARRPDLPA